MNDYFIQLENKCVSVSRIIKGELETIRINGDLTLPVSEFWILFKQKIEYETDERLAFIVLSDNTSFMIDSDIAIADNFTTEHSQLKGLIIDYKTRNTKLSTYPTLEMNFNKIKANEDERQFKQEIVSNSLQSFFKKKTRLIQRENYKATGYK